MNVENLQRLYSVGQKILRERLPFGFGDFECGTFACFLGYYWRETGYRDSREYCSGHGYVYDRMARHFGIGRAETTQLFAENCILHDFSRRADDTLYPGPAAYAELERRMAYLANLIREAGGTVPSHYTGLPDSIREIFDGNVPALALRQAG